MGLFDRTKSYKVPKRVPPLPTRDNVVESRYRMPGEHELHEGTWLQWPHDHGWDPNHVERYEPIWIETTRRLCAGVDDGDGGGEKVHIVVYDETERERVRDLLLRSDDETAEAVRRSRIDFHQWRTDDVWVRDNGPIFVVADEDKDGSAASTDDEKEVENSYDRRGIGRRDLRITNWIFNAWGQKAECYYDNYVPVRVGATLGVPVSDVPMVLEGGSIEVDGRGTLMAKRSSILNINRNHKGWTQTDMEAYFERYLGVTNFIWLDGKKGGNDITDDHIDGTARFANENTIVTYYKEDFLDGGKEYRTLTSAVDVNNEPYRIVHLPVTSKKVKGLDDYGIYINFYIGNDVVLVPTYNDPNDQVALDVIQKLYDGKNNSRYRRVFGICCNELIKDGGMIHCITQQQPAAVTRHCN